MFWTLGYFGRFAPKTLSLECGVGKECRVTITGIVRTPR